MEFTTYLEQYTEQLANGELSPNSVVDKYLTENPEAAIDSLNEQAEAFFLGLEKHFRPNMSEWLAPVRDEILALHRAGASPEQIADRYAGEIIVEPGLVAHIDSHDVIKEVITIIEQWG